MRLVQLVVADEQRDTALDALQRTGADTITTETEQDATVLSFPLPTGAVDDVLGQLRDAGVETDDYLLVTDLETATSPNLDALEEEYTEGPETGSRVPLDELQSTARKAEPDRVAFVAQVILSATVAAAGLLLDSAIAVVGSMVIAPFTNAALSLSVGAVIDDIELMANSSKTQLVGFGLAVITGGGVGLVARWASIVPSALAIESIPLIRAFSSPNLLILAIAVTAGGAGAFALATDQNVSIAGVAVAATIVPAAATIGVGLAWGNAAVAVGAATLLTTNVLLIHLVAFLVLTALGYRSGLPDIGDRALNARTAGHVFLIGVVLVAAVLTATVTYRYVAADRTINHEVSTTLDSPRYDRLVLTGVQTDYTGFSSVEGNSTVIVTIRKPAERQHPGLVRTLQRRIRSHTDQRVTVDVQFTDYR